MIKWILIITNMIIVFLMLLGAGFSSDEGDLKICMMMVIMALVSTFSAMYILLN